MSKKERVKYCDLLRFIAIISVVLIHVLADFRDGYLQTNRVFYFLLTFFDSFTRMAVPIFFMLTGIFMLGSKKKEKYSVFLKKRVSKLLIPFFVISVIYYLYEGIKNGSGFSVLQFLNSFSSNQIKYHFWFMYSIILIYLLIPFLRKMMQSLDRNDLKNLIFVIFISNILTVVCTLSRKFDYSFFSMFIYPSEIRYFNYLLLGYYLYQYGISKKYHKKLYLLGILSVILMPILDYFVTDTVREDTMLVAGACFPFISVMALFTFVKENYNKWKVNEKVEKFFSITNPLIFYIYMIHVLVMEIVKKVLLYILKPIDFRITLVFIVIEFVITFLISYILAYILNSLYNRVERKLFQKNLA